MDRRSLTFIVALAATITLSSIPITAQRNGEPPNAGKLQADRNDKGTKANTDKSKTPSISAAIPPATVAASGAPRTDPNPDPPKTKGERLSDWLWGFVTNQQTFSNLLLVIVGGAAFIIGVCTLFAIKREVKETAKAANAAKDSATAAKGTLATNREIERAYVGLNATKLTNPTTRLVTATKEPGSTFDVRTHVKNWGNTPADILDVVVCPLVVRDPVIWDEQLPEFPPYDRTRMEPSGRSYAFLVTTGIVTFDKTLFLTDKEWDSVRSRTRVLWLIGYVDYRDKFGVVHRGGYATRCKTGQDAEILDHIWEGTEHYNYDRPLRPEEAKEYAKS